MLPLNSGRKAVLRSLISMARDQVLAAALPEPHEWPPTWNEEMEREVIAGRVFTCEPQAVVVVDHQNGVPLISHLDIGTTGLRGCDVCRFDLRGSRLALDSIQAALEVLEHEASYANHDWPLNVHDLLEAASKQVPQRAFTSFWRDSPKAKKFKRPPLLVTVSKFFLALGEARDIEATSLDVEFCEAYFGALVNILNEYDRAMANGNTIKLADRVKSSAKGGES